MDVLMNLEERFNFYRQDFPKTLQSTKLSSTELCSKMTKKRTKMSKNQHKIIVVDMSE